MIYTAKVTQKGQVTIPKIIREKLGVKPLGRVRFVEDQEGNVKLKPLPTIDELAGSLRAPKRLRGLSDEELDKRVEEEKRKYYAKKYKPS